MCRVCCMCLFLLLLWKKKQNHESWKVDFLYKFFNKIEQHGGCRSQDSLISV